MEVEGNFASKRKTTMYDVTLETLVRLALFLVTARDDHVSRVGDW